MSGELVISNLRGAIVGPVDLTVGAGESAAISGPSGAGKSLLLRMIADLEPNEGAVLLGDLRRETVAAPIWRRNVGFVAAEAGWWTETASAHWPGALHDAARRLAMRLGLAAGDLERPVRTLSTGERQRLSLVRALVREPRALLLDEPTSALDPEAVARVEALLAEVIASGVTLVVVSHDPMQGRRLGAALYTMAEGRLARA